jgi:hypothetical protein
VEAKLPVAAPTMLAPLEVRLPDGTMARVTSAAELAGLVVRSFLFGYS